jgi:hypothetical protein
MLDFNEKWPKNQRIYWGGGGAPDRALPVRTGPRFRPRNGWGMHLFGSRRTGKGWRPRAAAGNPGRPPFRGTGRPRPRGAVFPGGGVLGSGRPAADAGGGRAAGRWAGGSPLSLRSAALRFGHGDGGIRPRSGPKAFRRWAFFLVKSYRLGRKGRRFGTRVSRMISGACRLTV